MKRKPQRTAAVYVRMPGQTERAKAVSTLQKIIADLEDLSLDQEDFPQCAGLFTNFLRSAVLREIIDYELRKIRGDAHYQPAGSSRQQMTLHNGRNFVLTAIVAKPAPAGLPAKLQSLNRDSFIGVVNSVDVETTVFRIGAADDALRDNPSVSFLRQGEAVLVRAGVDLVHLRPVSSAVLLTLASQPRFDAVTEYAADTLEPLRERVVNPELLWTRYMMELGIHYGDAGSAEALRNAAERGSPAVRAAAARAIEQIHCR